MMKHLNCFILLLSIFLVLPSSVYALDISKQSSSVFKFQQKLATKGNARAQFKLATMYETGTGVAQDIDQAKDWYNKASTAGIKAASDRMTYLAVKEQGYNKAKNYSWLVNIKKDAKQSKGDAMFLLAQLYRQGLGVKKDLNRSLEILDQVSLLGAADVEDEIELIEAEKNARNKSRARAAKKKEQEAARIAREKQQQIKRQAAKTPVVVSKPAAKPVIKVNEEKKIAVNPESSRPTAKPVPAKKLSKKAQASKAEQDKQAAKIRRYEKAMMQLKREQQLIDEQQKWSTGGEGDDEADDEI